ncbi:carbohydrate-binding protein [Amycolatopsis sp. NPDC059027]|uniref:carbohydrate-binding protein n=1 Tax=unclassified Amycolatopsis TaxID=2618356 RepID=UPI0036724DA9
MPSPITLPARVGRRRFLLLIGAMTAAVLITLPLTMRAQAALPPPPSGWTQVFADDFDGAAGSKVNPANWQYTTGTSYPGGPPNFGTGEVETMTDSTSNVALDGQGNLRITPVRDGAGKWTSGRIETVRSDFQPPANGTLRVESRLQMPNVTGDAAKGYWPAFWMLGAPFRGNWWNWPGIGEFDIMENVQGLNNEWATVHCGVSPGGPCNETTGIGGQHVCPGTACQAGFHTFALEWDRGVNPQQLRFYVDDVNFHTVRQDQVDATTWKNATDHGFFLILNVAMGGGFPDAFGGGPTAATKSGVPMVVDYVRVLSRGGGATTTTPTTPPNSGTRDAYGRIEAESADTLTGLSTEPSADAGGGQNLAQAKNGQWALYRNVDFGGTPASQFNGRVASGAGNGVSGLVEVRLDSATAAPIGSFAIASTGGWQAWRTVPANITGVTGKHDVYLTFTSGQPAPFVSLNWFTFGH